MTVFLSPATAATRAPLHTDTDTALVCRVLFSLYSLPPVALDLLTPARQAWAKEARVYLLSRLTTYGCCEGTEVTLARAVFENAFIPALDAFLASCGEKDSRHAVTARVAKDLATCRTLCEELMPR